MSSPQTDAMDSELQYALDGGLLEVKLTDLVLQNPTPEECLQIWTSTSDSWGDTLPLPVYLKESLFLTTVPLAKDGNMTTWILTDRNLPPNHRPILCSCETIRKRSVTSDAEGNTIDTVIHGIASVFCAPKYRRRGYAARMMKELSKTLQTWRVQIEPKMELRCVGSILYSDIGKTYYANLGWSPAPNNAHIEFTPSTATINQPIQAQEVLEEDLAALCQRDEVLMRRHMTIPLKDTDPEIKTRVTVIPDLDHMLWHMSKEDFATHHLFGNVPRAKGAILGEPGNQIWAIWTHRYYEQPDPDCSQNVLYILRLVVECDGTATRLPSDIRNHPPRETYKQQVEYLGAIVESARREAAEWKLNSIQLWDPTPLVQDMLTEIGVDYDWVIREEESIASCMWFDQAGEIESGEAPLWVNNEHYAWL